MTPPWMRIKRVPIERIRARFRTAERHPKPGTTHADVWLDESRSRDFIENLLDDVADRHDMS